MAQEYHERYDQPPAPPRAIVTSKAFRFSNTAASMVQVNVDRFGNNIQGDAANEPSIAIDPTAPNRMVIGFRQFDSIQSNFRQAGYAWTNNGGRTWHFDGVLEPGVFGSDPVLDSDSAGNFYFMSLHENFQCFLFKSIDGGKHWLVGVFAKGGDKEWMTIDRSGGIGDGNVYQAWSTVFFNRSVDGGLSFGPSKYISSGLWPTLAVGPMGELFVIAGGLVFRSDDAQDPGVGSPTFSGVKASVGGPVNGNPAGPNPGGLAGQIWIDVDRSDGPTRGYVYLAGSVDDHFGLQCCTDVMFSRSTDGGKTWSTPREITGEPDGVKAFQWFGTMSVAPNGRIDAVWNDTSIGDKINWSELRYTSSSDGGTTWARPVTLSPPWDSKIGWPMQNKIGDYYTMKSDLVGADLAWAATFTGGQDVYYMRIGDHDCNGNGVSDLADIAAGTAQDCNRNSIPDSCEIAAGAVEDANGNGVPDPCECYADFDGSGELDIDDFLAFQTAFAIGDLLADCDQSGELDIDDFICFQTAYGLGCP